ncbi:MAG: translation initiation factor IF-2 subunit gamma [Nanoarchaeota archaeon]
MAAEKEENKKIKSKKTTKKETLDLQPHVNIGLIGHVDHGKTTLTEKLTGRWTDTHSEEIKRGITIRLGYADTTIRKCEKCDEEISYTTSEKCLTCNAKTKIIRKISLVDAPGHESLMATMLAGATIMDGAILMVAANETCPQPQTREHIMALQIMGIKNVIVVQNKIDLVSKDKALKNYKQIKEFLKSTDYKDSKIIPISAIHNINLNILIKAIEEIIPTPKRDETLEPRMLIARSFDINKPGQEIKTLNGGILGGSLIQGVLKEGDEIEIRPGIRVEEKNQQISKPIKTKITSIATGNNFIKKATPGGSIAISTSLDPSIVKSDKLTGSLVGLPNKLPEILYNLKLEVNLLKRVVGSKEDLTVEPIKKMEALMLNVNSAATVGIVTDITKNIISCKLKLPVCVEKKSRVTISRLLGNRFRLIGYGIIK